MKKAFAIVLAVLMAGPMVAQAKKAKDDSPVKEHLQNHFKFYGFIRNYFAVDTRESSAGTGDLFYYLPKDVLMNEDGTWDMNSQPSFRFLSLTSRLGVDVSGYQVGRTRFGAKVEADFYAGLSKVDGGSSKINGVAQFRLRQAYMTVGWDDLKMSKGKTASVSLKIGQAWHPLAADQPHVTSLETGAPFNPFSRTPQVLMDAKLGGRFTLSAGAMWQMQYLSSGPIGSTADYMKYAGSPEGYLGLEYKSKSGFLAKAGFSVLSIKPRWKGTVKKEVNGEIKDVTVKVSDRITTFNPFIYIQYKSKMFEFKAKTVYGQAGEHLNLMSGYGVASTSFDDGHFEYVPLQTSSTWASISYGKKWQFMLMGGYIKNLGTTGKLETAYTDASGHEYADAKNLYFNGNGTSNLNAMWRIIPTVAYNVGKFTIALEYNMTAAQYGKYAKSEAEPSKKFVNAKNGLASDGLHWVYNNRVQLMVKFTF